MLTKRYLISAKNIAPIFKKIIDGTAPEKFSNEHLRGLGFKSSNDRAIIPVLKDLGFLTADGTPTQRYHNYRDHSKSKKILGEALKEAYSEIFHLNEKPTESDRQAILGKFKTTHNVSDKVAELQTKTFFTLLKLADISTVSKLKQPKSSKEEKPEPKKEGKLPEKKELPLSLRYNIEIHLPATKDIEVYNAIFKSLRMHLGD